MPANLENSAVATGLEKVSSNLKERQCQKIIPIPKKGNAKEWSSYSTIVLILHASKSMLKILSSTLPKNIQIYKLGLENAEEPEIKLPAFLGS